MGKYIRLIAAFSILTAVLGAQTSLAKAAKQNAFPQDMGIGLFTFPLTDTVPPQEVMDVVTAAVYAPNSFNIDAVANIYTPNAVITDDEPPYSWNGPTAGIQWVNAVEQASKDNHVTKLTGAIQPINVYAQNNDNVYIVVPVNYSGNLPGKQHFAVKGAFTFVLRLVNGKWLIKSQAWLQAKALR